MALTNQTNDKNQKERYCSVLERLHENQGDIYFSEEDYYRAIHEYRSALQYIDDKDISAKNLIPYLKCSLKVGMSYEYRHTFENAYMVYCQIINKLIQLRWMEESDYGLDYTMRLTKDWRIKNTVLVDDSALKGWYSNDRNEELRRHFKPGLYEDLKDYSSFNPHFSFDSDKTISSLSRNLTPEKSNMLLQLTAFEDIKFIYQAILAKLFVIEKMESSGITQSSIDAAEAEFVTLYSTVNYNEKYILASDFFSKLASILYYKNGVVSAEKDENVHTTLYLFDIDVFALIDDYCYFINGNLNYSNIIEVKDNVRDFFTMIKTRYVNMICSNDTKNLQTFFKSVIYSIIIQNKKIIPQLTSGIIFDTQMYLKYLDEKQYVNIQKKWRDIKECYDRRDILVKSGCKLPCTACKYANRSIVILMKELFGYDENVEIKVLEMLRYASHQKLFESRPEILSQLAASSEQLADIMMSCACTGKNKNGSIVFNDRILPATIELLSNLISKTSADERDSIIKEYQEKNSSNISRLDLTILWYWSACRYYDIASMHHEAVHCVCRIVKVIESYLTVLAYYNKRYGIDNNIEDISPSLVILLELLFTQASRIVGRQHDNYNSVEIHEIKWLLHYEHFDDIDLTSLTQFPNLQSIFISIVNSKKIIFQLNKPSFMIASRDGKKEDKDKYLRRIYIWFKKNRHVRTFKSDVEMSYLKSQLNHSIFISILGGYDVKQECINKGFNIGLYYPSFYSYLRVVLNEKPNREKKKIIDYYFNEFLGIKEKTIQATFDLLDFLIYDSISCLCNIINILPPHNQLSTFSNSFIANVYEDLWEWSKYYNMMHDMYLYYRYFLNGDMSGMDKMLKFFPKNERERYRKTLFEYAVLLEKRGVLCKDNFGYRYSKLFMTLQHDIDDATMHHILIDYSAEMAIKYYRAARGINSEGQEYKNLINNMYTLDDDLRKDTCQSNFANERYLLNSGVINCKREDMQKLYSTSKLNKMEPYESSSIINNIEFSYPMLQERYSDSPYTNTEY